jgi:beta-phosphoglucomutase-like phosphatase (HAD superfamily)
MIKRNEISAVIFDFNGTLFWDADFHDAAWQAFGEAHGISLTPSDLEEHVIGFTNEAILSYLFDRPLTPDDIARYSREKERLYRERCLAQPARCRLASGAIDFLEHVKRLGLRRTIATASIIEAVEFFFRTFSLDKWFVFEETIYDDGVHRGKPHPDMHLAAAEVLGVPIERCMIIEDSFGGIEAAKRAGAGHVVAMAPGDSRARLDRVGGISQIVRDFTEIDRRVLGDA